MLDAARPYVDSAKKVLFAGGTTLLSGILQLALSIFIAFFFLRDGDAIVSRLHAAIDRIAGERGRRLALVAATTVRGVVLGILGTAIAQGVLMAVGLWLAGFKAAPLLGLVTFFLSPVPVGPPLVWIPAGLILLSQGETGWGIFLFVWGAVVVSSVDNFLKPMIISRGSALPFVLVLLGVLGGAVAFGFVGVFLGPGAARGRLRAAERMGGRYAGDFGCCGGQGRRARLSATLAAAREHGRRNAPPAV